MNTRVEKAGSEKARGHKKRYMVEKTRHGAIVKPQDNGEAAHESLHGTRQPDEAAATAGSAEQHRAMIAQAAYYRAERRGFAPGCELDDWLAAEAEISASRLAQV